jgi:hypothetical protein
LPILRDAEAYLWAEEGAEALAYLRDRGLSDETIRAARLGATPALELPGRPRGVVLAWWDGDAPVLAKIRQPEGRQPKYYELFRDPARSFGLYPGPHVVRVGRPVVVVEGELDALLLGQELADLASVVTLGNASAIVTPAIMGALLPAPNWFLATDGDDAGEKAAARWPARARRVRPPGRFKDWTEVWQAGVNLRRWWGDVLAGAGRPALFTWEEVRPLRWGSGIGDPEDGIDRTGPDDPSAWRWTAANLPWDRWRAWRRRSAELAQVEGLADPEDRARAIEAAENQALAELLAQTHDQN